MKHFLIAAFLFFSIPGFTQNYNPFPFGSTFQYSYSGGDSTYILKILSSKKIGVDSVSYFNPVVTWTERPNSGELDSNNVFGRKMIISDQMYTCIFEEDTFYFHPYLPINQSFKFNASLNGEVESRGIEAVEGVSDSVVTVRISNGAQFKLSKSFGLIKGVPLDKINQFEEEDYYVLTAIPEKKLGEFILDPFVIYDFEVGDRFGFSEEGIPFQMMGIGIIK